MRGNSLKSGLLENSGCWIVLDFIVNFIVDTFAKETAPKESLELFKRDPMVPKFQFMSPKWHARPPCKFQRGFHSIVLVPPWVLFRTEAAYQRWSTSKKVVGFFAGACLCVGGLSKKGKGILSFSHIHADDIKEHVGKSQVLYYSVGENHLPRHPFQRNPMRFQQTGKEREALSIKGQ